MRIIIGLLLFTVVCIYSPATLAKEDSMGIDIEMLPWEEVNKIIPKYSKFTILDVETGKYFKVQRRAGSGHADVQPLTTKDTKIMKDIYGGKWSWKRRAIIIMHEDRWIAASMHGMPHGAGALANSFPGHFCIHFYGSKTHRTKEMDLSHKLMILKSAGLLEDHLNNADPFALIGAYVAAIKQHDETITSMISLQPVNWKEPFKKVANIKLKQMSPLTKEELNELILEIPVRIEWIDSFSKKKIYDGSIFLFRPSLLEGWKVDSVRFFKESEIIATTPKMDGVQTSGF